MTQGLRVFIALIAGALFGFGLAISGMLDPTRVRGFLDIFGAWDPSLAFVLGGAVAAALLGTAVKRAMRRPWLDSQFHMPEKTEIDGRLLIGAAIFGIGWGMAGLCPGPALADLSLGGGLVFGFVAAMLAGMIIHDRFLSAPSC